MKVGKYTGIIGCTRTLGNAASRKKPIERVVRPRGEKAKDKRQCEATAALANIWNLKR